MTAKFALITLDRLAEAMSDPRLGKYDFLMGGHTDGVGGSAYNQALSERRVLAVKRYLVDKRGVSGARLVDKGFKKQRLLEQANPTDGVNRPVQIVTLSIPLQ